MKWGFQGGGGGGETVLQRLLRVVVTYTIGTLSSDDDDAGENVRKTIVLISKTLAVHVRYNLWYISLPFNAKQRRVLRRKM